MSTLKKGVSAFYKGLDYIIDFALIILFALLTVILSVEVIGRFLFGHSLIWAQEIARYLFAWLVYIGAAAVFSKGGHLAVDVLLNKFPLRIKYILSLVFYLIMIAFLTVIFFTGLEYATVNFDKPLYSAPFANMGIVYMGLPLGCCLMVLNICRELYRMLTMKLGYFMYKEGRT